MDKFGCKDDKDKIQGKINLQRICDSEARRRKSAGACSGNAPLLRRATATSRICLKFADFRKCDIWDNIFNFLLRYCLKCSQFHRICWVLLNCRNRKVQPDFISWFCLYMMMISYDAYPALPRIRWPEGGSNPSGGRATSSESPAILINQ